MEILLYIENRHFLELSYERLDHQARINHDSFVYGFQNQNFGMSSFLLTYLRRWNRLYLGKRFVLFRCFSPNVLFRGGYI